MRKDFFKLKFFTTKVHKGFSQRTQKAQNVENKLFILCALCVFLCAFALKRLLKQASKKMAVL